MSSMSLPVATEEAEVETEAGVAIEQDETVSAIIAAAEMSGIILPVVTEEAEVETETEAGVAIEQDKTVSAITAAEMAIILR
jgi:hypothetical protein